MPTSKVNPSDIYTVWQRMNCLWAKLPQGRVKYKMGVLVRITKRKLHFANGYEDTLSIEIGLSGYTARSPTCYRTRSLAS
jgi:hypothetical protein